VGSPGRSAVIENLAGIKEEYEIDFIIVNGENSAGGRGITPKICIDLLRAGSCRRHDRGSCLGSARDFRLLSDRAPFAEAN
jgi:hypothetical protein